ncbi:hypothetical protein V8E36_000710 [Tilletia maclaganii]
MDLYQRFDLPPPPPPTIFSTDRSDMRARFPELQDAAELRRFMRGLLIMEGPDSWQPWFAVVAVLLFGQLLILVSIMVRSARNQRWWCLQTQSSRRGVVIPHGENCWCICVSAGLIMMILFLWVELASHGQRALPLLPLWIYLIPWPLSLGLWWQTSATTLAARSTASGKTITSGTRREIPPWLLNAALFIPPFVIACVLIGIASWVEHYYQLDSYEAFKDRYRDQEALTRDMLLDAQQIWNHRMRGVYIFTIGMLFWMVAGGGQVVVAVWIMRSTARGFSHLLGGRGGTFIPTVTTLAWSRNRMSRSASLRADRRAIADEGAVAPDRLDNATRQSGQPPLLGVSRDAWVSGPPRRHDTARSTTTVESDPLPEASSSPTSQMTFRWQAAHTRSSQNAVRVLFVQSWIHALSGLLFLTLGIAIVALGYPAVEKNGQRLGTLVSAAIAAGSVICFMSGLFQILKTALSSPELFSIPTFGRSKASSPTPSTTTASAPSPWTWPSIRLFASKAPGPQDQTTFSPLPTSPIVSPPLVRVFAPTSSLGIPELRDEGPPRPIGVVDRSDIGAVR